MRVLWPIARRTALVTAVVWAALELFVPRLPLLDGIDFSRIVRARDGTVLRVTRTADDKLRLRTTPAQVSRELASAVVLHEDRFFRWHPGVNPAALVRAAWHSVLIGDRRLGASTITMQVARLRFGLRTASVLGKLEQIAVALALEWRYDKDEILEAYLSLLPVGGDVEGLGAGSLVWFGKPATRLNLSEALALAVAAPGPARRSPHSRRFDVRAVDAARRALLVQWLTEHPEDGGDAALLVPPPAARRVRSAPRIAPHLVDAVLAAHPGRAELVTTIDVAAQRVLEEQIRSTVERRSDVGIRNAAALLVDRGTMEVTGSVGSAAYLDAAIHGQVDGTRARRSPGSLVKPFVYALAFEQGLAQPSTMLRDTPLHLGEYDPENADGRFAGPISAHDALIRSRNVPALRLSAQLRRPTFFQFLERLGVRGLREESYYGLAPALGGVEMTMQDVARGYAMLANGGVARPLRVLRDDPRDRGERLLSPEACGLVMGILRDNPRPGEATRAEWIRGRPPVAWKSGTSNGARDAWAAAVFGSDVLVVWVGNFDGTGNPALTGSGAAAPLLFQIVDALAARGHGRTSSDAGAELAQVEVCAVSGELAGPHCRRRVATWFAPGRSPIRTCSVHRADAAAPGQVREVWPSDVTDHFRRAGLDLARSSATSVAGEQGRSPQITSPRNGVTYFLRAASPDSSIPLMAVTDGDVRELFWFADQTFLGRTPAGEPLDWSPAPGPHVVRVIDDQGRSASVEMGTGSYPATR